MKTGSSRTFVDALLLIGLLLYVGCKKDDSSPTQPPDTVSNYVKLGFNYDKVSPDAPKFDFLKENNGTYSLQTTNIVRGGSFNMITSYDALYTFVSTGNTYKIIVTNIQSTGLKYYPGGSYVAKITATVSGRTISGTLNYP